jgi:arsenite methyltransferase
MKSYLHHSFSPDDPDLISVIDDLPLWAAPFGLKLLETVRLKPRITVIDVGCGLGFPTVEIAQRLGQSCTVVGLDLWEVALNRARQKLDVYAINNAAVILGNAEGMPFGDQVFDLVLSNNGLSNVDHLPQALHECSRVSKPGAQFVFTYNLENTMIEFYNIFEAVLSGKGLTDSVTELKEHIHEKRKPIEEMKRLFSSAGFEINNIAEDSFLLDFLDAAALFDHNLIKYWFLPIWKEIMPEQHMESVFGAIEEELDAVAARNGQIRLTVPYVTIDATRT